MQGHELRHEVFEIGAEVVAKLATDEFFDLMTTGGAPRVTEECRLPLRAVRASGRARDTSMVRRK
jgi:hypothetical protein